MAGFALIAMKAMFAAYLYICHVPIQAHYEVAFPI